VLVAAGDEDLCALDGVGAIGELLRRGGRRADVGAGLRLGEAHRPRPAPLVDRGEVLLLLRRGAEALDHLADAFGESRVHGEGGVGAGQHLVDEGGERAWRALPAVLLVDGENLPPGLVELLPGLLEAGRRDDLAVLEPAADLVADRVERPGDLAREAIELAE